MHILSVSKSYSHRGGNHIHRPSTKRRWNVYYVTDEGLFASKPISPLMVPYYKSKRERYTTMACNWCGTAFVVFYKKSKDEAEGQVCPICMPEYYRDDDNDEDDED